MYENFGRSLLESERPSDLSAGELSDYEAALEDEAFPFEEKSIHVHEKNLELMTSGVFNAWTEKSLARLALLAPGRYAKPEESTGPLAAIDTYAYRTPATPPLPQAPPAEATTEALRAEPIEVDAATSEALPAEPAQTVDALPEAPSEAPPASLDSSGPPQEVIDHAEQ